MTVWTSGRGATGGRRSEAPRERAPVVVCAPFDLSQEFLEQRECVGVLLRLEEQRSEARLDALTQEGSLLRLAPLDGVAAELHLELARARDLSEVVDERAHNLGGLRLRHLREEGAQRHHERNQLVRELVLGAQLAQPRDRLLLDGERVGVGGGVDDDFLERRRRRRRIRELRRRREGLGERRHTRCSSAANERGAVECRTSDVAPGGRATCFPTAVLVHAP
jgi:hypothetical protein